MALKNVNTLLQLTTNLINFERIDVYSSTLYVSEYELNSYMNDVCATFRKYAEMKRVRFVYESNFDYLNVWFDSDKMGSILKNILSNALKYTPEPESPMETFLPFRSATVLMSGLVVTICTCS